MPVIHFLCDFFPSELIPVRHEGIKFIQIPFQCFGAFLLRAFRFLMPRAQTRRYRQVEGKGEAASIFFIYILHPAGKFYLQPTVLSIILKQLAS